MTKSEANRLLSYYCPFIKEQFKKNFERKPSIQEGHIYYTNGVTIICGIEALSQTLTFIQNIRIAAVDYYEENRR